MDEAEWLKSTDVAGMLQHVQSLGTHPRSGVTDAGTARRLRLFAVAACRAVEGGVVCERCGGSGRVQVEYDPGSRARDLRWVLCPAGCVNGRVGGLADERSRRAVEVSERYADEGEVVAKEMGRAWLYMDMESPHEPAWILPYLACSPPDTLALDLMAHADAVAKLVPPAAQAALLREIVGNPFRPASCGWQIVRAAVDMSVAALESGASEESVWRGDWLITRTVLGLAQTIYNDRQWDLMPMLHDALIDAGCDDADILGHCRGLERCQTCLGHGWYHEGPRGGQRSLQKCDCRDGWIPLRGPHVRGCHVVDLLTGRE